MGDTTETLRHTISEPRFRITKHCDGTVRLFEKKCLNVFSLNYTDVLGMFSFDCPDVVVL